jgi:hypothetical protein
MRSVAVSVKPELICFRHGTLTCARHLILQARLAGGNLIKIAHLDRPALSHPKQKWAIPNAKSRPLNYAPMIVMPL